jgi:hypothetical protein
VVEARHPSRRTFLLALAGLVYCRADQPARSPRPSSATTRLGKELVSYEPADAPRRLAAELKAGRPLPDLYRAVAELALTRCNTVAADAVGTVSHALLGVDAAARTARFLPVERQALPLLHVARWVVAEARNSPYHPGDFSLTSWPAGDDSPSGTMHNALQRRDIDAADLAFSRMHGNRSEASRVIVQAAMSQGWGHGGHACALATAGARLAAAYGDLGFLRPAVRYLASVHKSHRPLEDERAAEGSGRPAPDPRGLVNEVARWFLTARTNDLVGSSHLPIAVFSVLQGDEADTTARLHAQSWLRRHTEQTEVQAPPVQTRGDSTHESDLSASVAAGDITGAIVQVQRRVASKIKFPELLAWIAETASIGARRSVLHTLELAAASLEAPGDPELTLALPAALVASLKVGSDDRHAELCDLLEVSA